MTPETLQAQLVKYIAQQSQLNTGLRVNLAEAERLAHRLDKRILQTLEALDTARTLEACRNYRLLRLCRTGK